MFLRHMILATAILLLPAVSGACNASAQGADDTIGQDCVAHGFKPGTPIYASCYQAVFARRIAVTNLALQLMGRQQSNSPPQSLMYGYIMPDGQLVICGLSPDGKTHACTNNLQLAWP